jgi:hypothetical protein
MLLAAAAVQAVRAVMASKHQMSLPELSVVLVAMVCPPLSQAHSHTTVAAAVAAYMVI